MTMRLTVRAWTPRMRAASVAPMSGLRTTDAHYVRLRTLCQVLDKESSYLTRLGLAVILSAMSTTEQVGHAVPSWDLTDRLVKARAHANLNQAELAERLDVSAKTLQRYEQGRAAPRRGIILGWAVATGVSPSWLEHGTVVSTPDGDPGGTSTDSARYPYTHHPRWVA
ncbi:hypothetical protein BH24ACT15_BH24ACT15_30340 [soil metagenome]